MHSAPDLSRRGPMPWFFLFQIAFVAPRGQMMIFTCASEARILRMFLHISEPACTISTRVRAIWRII
ncbi:conserved protein of unknown function [Pseudomonas marincola]|uniref:Uncharacterized protein n=1 Tax=Pseudomonas marincola TaxID=437900 RepID=A0A653EAW4_9PSED|nr:conserved protein of unknown function [Pseudomonas marincola]